MSDPLKKTLDTLAKIKNDAAIDVLWLALKSSDTAIQEGALRALVRRRHAVSHRQLIEMWSKMPSSWHEIIAERPDRLLGAIRSMIVGTDQDQFKAGCEVLRYFKEYDLLPALVTAVEEPTNENADLAAVTLLELSSSLYEELSSRKSKRRRRDPSLVRRNLISSFQQSVQRYPKHQRREILEAFLIIAPRDNVTLKRILQDPYSKAFLPLIDLLNHSSRPGIIRQVLGFLNDHKTPVSAINVLANRTDVNLVRNLMRKIGSEPTVIAKSNLSRIECVAWIRDDMSLLDELEDVEQYAAVQFAMATKIPRDDKFRLVRYLLEHGQPAGRRAASAVLAEFNGVEANQLAIDSLNDEDPQVQANSLVQLRRRGVPGAVVLLIDMLDSPHAIVREAVRQVLTEFHIDRFLSTFYTLEDDVRESTGLLVARVDPTCSQRLAKEMKSPARSTRLRAIEVAQAVRCAQKLEVSLLSLMEDDDHLVRAAAAETLDQCQTAETRAALRRALLDKSHTVQEAAERSLQTLIASGMSDLTTEAATIGVAIPNIPEEYLAESSPSEDSA